MLVRTSKLGRISFMNYFKETFPLTYFADMSYIEISGDLRSRLRYQALQSNSHHKFSILIHSHKISGTIDN